MSFFNRRLLYRIGLYSTAGIIAYSIYARANIPPETDEEYCKRKGMVKIHDQFYKYDVYEHGEMKPFVDLLTDGCNGNSFCDIDRAYQYVLKIPYKESTQSRTPADVINQNGGDCDEKSFLLATLLLQKHYRCLLIMTKEHAFLTIHLPDESKIRRPNAYVTFEGEKYYFAETTLPHGYIGQYNNIREQEVEGVFDMTSKEEIPSDKISFFTPHT